MNQHARVDREASLLALLSALHRAGPLDDAACGVAFVTRGGRMVAEMDLADGTTVCAYQHDPSDPAQPDAAGRAVAAGLCREAGIVAPGQVELDARWPLRHGIEVFQRPSLPTLADVWPTLSPGLRARARRSCGELILRVRDIGLQGLGEGVEPPRILPLQWELAHALGVVLFPAIAELWPLALGTVEGLLETIPEVAARTAQLPAYALRCDPAPDCVLVRADAEDARCVGFAVPPTIGTAPPEAALARAGVHLREAPDAPIDPGGLTAAFGPGVDEADPVLVGFFAALELLGLGLAHARADRHDAADTAFAQASGAMEWVHVAYLERVREQAMSAGLREHELAPMLPREGGGRHWSWMHPIRAAKERLHRRSALDRRPQARGGPADGGGASS